MSICSNYVQLVLPKHVFLIVFNIGFSVVAADVSKGTFGARPPRERNPCAEPEMSFTPAVDMI